MKKDRRRRRRFIDRQVQLALALQVLKHWILLLFVAFALLSFAQVLFATPNGSFIDRLVKVWSEHALFLMVALALSPLFVIDVIHLSHRFVGPVLRVRQELRRIAEGGSCKPIVLRKNDLWKGLATDFNAALAAMERDTTPALASPTTRDEETALKKDTVDQDTVDQDAQLVTS